MEIGDSKATEKIKDIAECYVCLKTCTDPRMLPCMHTYCLGCLEDIGAKTGKKPGETIPCPVCRKEFTIPDKGFEKIQKNSFVEKLLEVRKISKPEDRKVVLCDICKSMANETTSYTPLAEMYCVHCQENLCSDCIKRHAIQKMSRYHSILEMGCKLKDEEFNTFLKPLACDQHPAKILDYYCADCKKVVCVSCFVESHKLHTCSDVSKVSDKFRKTIEGDLEKISTCLTQGVAQKEQLKRHREEFTQDVSAKRKAIVTRSNKLKETVDRDAKSLLEEMTDIEVKRIKEMETESETIETDITVMESLKAFGSALADKGSPADICHSVHKIHERSNEMEVCIKSRAQQVPTVLRASFRANKLHKSNCIGTVQAKLEKTLIIVGFDLGESITEDVVKISLHRENEVCRLDPLPTSMGMEATATVMPEKEILFVIGVGRDSDEIWIYHSISKWSKCGSLVQKRRRHCATFVENLLYISGGSLLDVHETVLDSVEAFNTETDECSMVGQLVHAVECASSVARGNSVYVFGGYGKDDRQMDYVQVYDTVWNQCTILSSRVPLHCGLMRAVLWENSVILFGTQTCFLFNFETAAWQERKRFKTDVNHFGFIIDDDKIFVVGGGNSDDLEQWTCTDDVRYIPLVNFIEDKPVEWKTHAKLPKLSLVHAFGGMMLQVA